MEIHFLHGNYSLCYPTPFAHFYHQLPSWFTKVIPTDKIHLGLDLQGGMHLILEVEADKAVDSYIEQIVSNLKDDLKENGIPVGKAEREKDEIVLEFSGSKEKVDNLLIQRFTMLHEKSSSGEGGIWKYRMVLDSKDVENTKKHAIEQALEIIRNRIDQFGVSEPEITLQGTDQILVQLPGVKDPERAINLIGKTALLEFKLVDDEGNLDEALKGRVPPGDLIFYQRSVDPQTGAVRKVPYLLKEKTLMTGDVIKDARVAIDSQFHEPYVAMEFNDIGAKLFEQITGANVKKRLAIILDNNVYSAPVIQERIGGGRAQITGRFDMKEASDLAIVLRSGSLPAPVKIVEQRTVGPSLGQDSIQAGDHRHPDQRGIGRCLYAFLLQGGGDCCRYGPCPEHHPDAGDPRHFQGDPHPAGYCRPRPFDWNGGRCQYPD